MAKKAAPKAAPTAAAAPAEKKTTAKPATKGEVFSKLAETSGLTKKQISALFDSLSELIRNELGKKGPGLFVIPGLLKLKVDRKPAKKAGERMDPFTKQMKMFPAKPAHNVVRARPLKALKEMV
jgi:nucleoid DNA-binding protein